MSQVRNFIFICGCKEGGAFAWFFTAFALFRCFFVVCRLRAFLAFPWQAAEPDVLQRQMEKVPQECAAAALTSPSSTGEGTLVLFSVLSTELFFFFLFSQTSVKSELFHILLRNVLHFISPHLKMHKMDRKFRAMTAST